MSGPDVAWTTAAGTGLGCAMTAALAGWLLLTDPLAVTAAMGAHDRRAGRNRGRCPAGHRGEVAAVAERTWTVNDQEIPASSDDQSTGRVMVGALLVAQAPRC